MHRRQKRPLPKIWLITDERTQANLYPALEALPRGSGVIFRHFSLAEEERRTLFEAVRFLARRRRLWLILVGPEKLARAWRADGSHGLHRGAVSAPVHNLREMIVAERGGAQLLFVSPVFATRTHPGAKGLGRIGFARVSQKAKLPVIALGGMNSKRAKTLNSHGWAGIDAFAR
jgi:thiamine-phosphate pyrophosphorylase